jgi:hypothetical protein
MDWYKLSDIIPSIFFIILNQEQPVAHLQLVVPFKPETFNFQPLEPAYFLRRASSPPPIKRLPAHGRSSGHAVSPAAEVVP